MGGEPDREALLRSLEARAKNERLTERTLWDEATRGLIQLRFGGANSETGRAFLRRKRAAAESSFWLYRMASINGRPLLSRWIEEVLQKINEEWDKIECPQCGGRSGLIVCLPIC
jgi:hypothetical protein